MVLHVVLFRPRASLAGAERVSFIEAFETALRDIPSIRRVRVGARVTHGRGYEQLMREDYPYAAILEFDDLDGLLTYLGHPSHDALGAKLFESVEAVLIYDYEVKDGGAVN